MARCLELAANRPAHLARSPSHVEQVLAQPHELLSLERLGERVGHGVLAGHVPRQDLTTTRARVLTLERR